MRYRRRLWCARAMGSPGGSSVVHLLQLGPVEDAPGLGELACECLLVKLPVRADWDDAEGGGLYLRHLGGSVAADLDADVVGVAETFLRRELGRVLTPPVEGGLVERFRFAARIEA